MSKHITHSSNQEARRADIVVVGGGGSGLAAAVRAAELGARIILLEKHKKLGGTTSLSLGAFAASNSSLQRQAGIQDSPEQQFADMSALSQPIGDRDNARLRRIFTENSGRTLDWLLSHGVRFYGPLADEGMNSVPRMCIVLPSSSAYIYRLRRAARKLGVTIVTGCRVDSLSYAPDGSISGITGRFDNGGTLHIDTPNVILAGGDFSANEQMKRAYTREQVCRVDPINPASTGDGICLGLTAGGRVLNGDLEADAKLWLPYPKHRILPAVPAMLPITATMRSILGVLPKAIVDFLGAAVATGFITLSPNLFAEGALLVNRRGERFMIETGAKWETIADQPGRDAFVILGKRLVDFFSKKPNYIASNSTVGSTVLGDYRRFRKEVYHSAKSLPDLARSTGVPATQLKDAINEYNETAPTDRQLTGPPYVALGPVSARLTICNTGLAVDEQLRVLKGDLPVEGLYGAGSNGQSGMLLQGMGVHIGWAFVSGRLAAEHAVGRLNGKRTFNM
jgi:fumarate reductase flavoprotein subunit